jgi:BirA family biotin operon repressor/biotin-[acetyl-CoA-carboxylase] ligase
MPLSSRQLAHRADLADVRIYPRVRSTNTRAAELINSGDLQLPGAILATRQTSGRGRGQNTWYADAGSLAVTFVFPADPVRPAHQLPLIAGLAARNAAAPHVDPATLKVKWPNDLLAHGRKLAGILCERVRDADLIGIGMNVATDFSHAPPEVQHRAVSLAELTPTPPTREQVFIDLAIALREALASPHWHAELSRVHALTGRHVAIDTGDAVIRGTCTGIDEEGRLLVREGATLHRILAGSVLSP